VLRESHRLGISRDSDCSHQSGKRDPVTLTILDPKPALVVIDLQKGLMAVPTVHPLEQVVDRAARLASAFRRHQHPVVLVNAIGRAPGRTEADQARRSDVAPSPDWATWSTRWTPNPTTSG
jgi:nicotinamidase-related amidase